MAYVDIDLDLQVLRVNVSGIRGDVHEAKAHEKSRQRARALRFADVAASHARYERLQEQMRRLEERLAALELRCCCQALTDAEHTRN